MRLVVQLFLDNIIFNNISVDTFLPVSEALASFIQRIIKY